MSRGPSIGYQLKQTQHVLRLKMDEALQSIALTTPQYAVLAHLQQQPGISNARLARDSFVTAQTMHGIIANLEKRKLVQRSCDPNHGRILCTQLTKQGVTVLKKAQILIAQVEKKMTKNMTKKESLFLMTLLFQCQENLCDDIL